MQFRPLTKEEATYSRLKEDILRGLLKPGMVISENDFAQRYGVSHSPVRHAIARAQEVGWLQSIPRKGYVVTHLNLADIQEILFLRSVIEPLAASLAAQRITDPELAQLRDLSGVSYKVGDQKSHFDFMQVNKVFHLTIARASRNRRLESWIAQLLDEMQRVILQAIPFGRQHVKREEHQRLVDALESRNAELAHAVALETVQASSNRISSFFHGDEGP